MIGQIVLWTLAMILIIVVGGGCIAGIVLSFLDQVNTRRRWENVRDGYRLYRGRTTNR